MIAYKDIREVHLEISSECNASCPLCPRNLYGYPHNGGYPEHSMTLDEAKHIFPVHFVKQLDQLLINGNFGDIVMNSESTNIIRYFRQWQPNIKIAISTNGGARSENFWRELAELDCEVFFCLDGLEDTHSLYRINTVFSTVLKNAKTFIAAGGHAIWKYIVFDHNRHQIDQARQMSVEVGFKEFALIDQGRNFGPVFNKNRQLVNTLGDIEPIQFMDIYRRIASPRDDMQTELASYQDQKHEKIACETIDRKTIYVNSMGEVYPCCYTGFSPRTYGIGRMQEPINHQLRTVLGPNQGYQQGIHQAIKWFDRIPPTWQIERFDQGRMLVCDIHCGKNS